MGHATINTDWMIPVAPGQAVTRGWKTGRPRGFTWHWPVATKNIIVAQTIGGKNAERKGVASAHCSIGQTFKDGIWFFVSVENASWHAGKNQTVNIFGKPLANSDENGSRDCYGVEVCSAGARYGARPDPSWFLAADPLGTPIWFPPWPGECVEMCIQVGRMVVKRFPHIGPDHHHGHHDLCPTDPQGRVYKIDPIGFPFAAVLRGIYPGTAIFDHWTPTLTVHQRQRALVALGYDLGRSGPKGDGVDGAWGGRSRRALVDLQEKAGLAANGCFGTFSSRAIAAALGRKGLDLARVTKAEGAQ